METLSHFRIALLNGNCCGTRGGASGGSGLPEGLVPADAADLRALVFACIGAWQQEAAPADVL